MVRKAIITVLTLATVGSVWVWVASHIGGGLGDRVDLGRTGFSFVAVTGLEFLAISPSQPANRNRVPNVRRWLGGRFMIAWSGNYLALGFPAWVPCAIFGAYPLFTLGMIPLRRWRRRRRGLCLKCSYDLTGNESGVCPECGKPI